MSIEIKLLTSENFAEDSLDGFIRTQSVTEVYRKIEGEYRLVEQPFTDDWSAQRKRENAQDILSGEYISYGALENGRVVGFVTLQKQLDHGRMIVDSFHVSAQYRHKGWGRRLFDVAIEQGRAVGACKLYFSACSSKETIAFYRAMGCVLAKDVIAEMVQDEPYDLQLEYVL